ncbi:MAG: MarR family transcriptional regulator [Proteobacteria bacterium]|nr:MarR family transcriptional regulator [Pseudomonadota bacterium]
MTDLKLIRILENLHRLERKICPILSEAGLTLAQLRLMRQIIESEPVASSRLSDALGITRASITGQIKDLEKLGYTASNPNPEDGRSSLISLSSQGRQRLESVLQRVAKLETLLDDALLAPLAQTLNQLTHSLD